MLTRIEIDGFKSFEDLAVDLSPFTLVVGSNGAGKSNLFDAIQLLASLASTDVASAMQGMRGEPLDLFRRTPTEPATRMHLAVEVLLDPVARDPWGSEITLKHTRLRYELTLERRTGPNGIERVQVAKESASSIPRNDDDWARAEGASREFRKHFLRYGRAQQFLTTGESDGVPVFEIHQDGRAGRKRPATAAEATVLSSVTSAEFPHLFALREELRRWRLLQLDPVLLRRPVPAHSPDELSEDGSNLAAVLARLKAETRSDARPMGALSDISIELNGLVGGIRRIDADLHEASREYRVEATMRDGLTFSAQVLSDGTLRVLALLTLLHDPKSRGLVCFEEPENGVHPGRLRQLMERLQAMVTRPSDREFPPGFSSQLILNSHSPVALSAVLNEGFRARDCTVLFADVSSVTDSTSGVARQRTRLRSVRRDLQQELRGDGFRSSGYVSEIEVRQILDTATER